MKKIKSVCVYCASSSKINPDYFEAAREIGRLLARQGMRCVCGAGNQGLMGTLADSVLAHGGEVLGVIPQFMIDEGWCHPGLTQTVVTADMHERKERMAQEADAVIALPGGCGTLEELFEIITWKQRPPHRDAAQGYRRELHAPRTRPHVAGGTDPSRGYRRHHKRSGLGSQHP